MDIQTQVEALRQRLHKHKGNYQRICEIGDLDYSWLNKFSRGVHKNPGVLSVSALQRALDKFEAEQGEQAAA